MLLSTVIGILNLSSIDKRQIAEKVQVPAEIIKQGGLFDGLGGISIICGFVLLLALSIIVLVKVCSHPKL